MTEATRQKWRTWILEFQLLNEHFYWPGLAKLSMLKKLRTQLKREGYDEDAVVGGSLHAQLKELINAARLEHGVSPTR